MNSNNGVAKEEVKIFEYKDIDDNDKKIEINLEKLTVIIFATTYNYKGEITSRNKCVNKWYFKKKNKLFNSLKNSIGNMSYITKAKYDEFIDKLEKGE